VVGDLVSEAGFDVAVEAVVGDVQLAADEPFREWGIPIEDGVPLLEPRDVIFGLLGPEGLEVLGVVVDLRIGDDGVAPEVGRGQIGRASCRERV